MSKKDAIAMDFELARTQAERLEKLAAQMTSLAKKKMDHSLEMIAGSWESENATIYLRKGEELEEEIKETAGRLRGIANDIRSIAQRIYDAEMKALKRVRKK